MRMVEFEKQIGDKKQTLFINADKVVAVTADYVPGIICIYTQGVENPFKVQSSLTEVFSKLEKK